MLGRSRTSRCVVQTLPRTSHAALCHPLLTLLALSPPPPFFRRFEEPSAYEYGECGNSPGTNRNLAAVRDRYAALTGEEASPRKFFRPWGSAWDADAEGAVEVVRAKHRPSTDSALPVGKRRWGPLNSGANFKFKELPPSTIFHRLVYEGGGEGEDGEEEDGSSASNSNGSGGGTRNAAAALRSLIARSLSRGSVLDSSGPSDHPSLPGLRLSKRTTVGGRQVDWLDGPLWVIGLDNGKEFSADPLKWFSRVSLLYDAQRHNATGPFGSHPRDGYLHHLVRWQIAAVTSITMEPKGPNTAKFRTGSQWGPLPPQEYVVFAGPGALEVQQVDSLHPLSRALLELSMQRGAKPFFSTLRDNYNIEHGRLLCSNRGAVLGSKPKFFTGRSDGWMFRQYGYMHSGLAGRGISDISHPKVSPRKVRHELAQAAVIKENAGSRAVASILSITCLVASKTM